MTDPNTGDRPGYLDELHEQHDSDFFVWWEWEDVGFRYDSDRDIYLQKFATDVDEWPIDPNDDFLYRALFDGVEPITREKYFEVKLSDPQYVRRASHVQGYTSNLLMVSDRFFNGEIEDLGTHDAYLVTLPPPDNRKVIVQLGGSALFGPNGTETTDLIERFKSGERTPLETFRTPETQPDTGGYDSLKGLSTIQLSEAKTLAATLLKVDPSTFDQSSKEFPKIRAFYLWENVRGGRALVIGHDRSVLFANSSVRPSDHRQAFANGERTPVDQFE